MNFKLISIIKNSHQFYVVKFLIKNQSSTSTLEVTQESNHIFVQWKDAIRDLECLKIEMIILGGTLISNLTSAVFAISFIIENIYLKNT